MSNPTTNQSRRVCVEWTVLGVALILLAAVLIGTLVNEHRRVEARESDRLQAQARVVDENLIRQFDAVNSALTAIRDGVEAAHSSSADAATADRLMLLKRAMPGVRTLGVVNAQGVVVASSHADLVGTSVAGFDFFTVPQRQHDRGVLYVSPPFRAARSPLVSAFARATSDARGGFAGVVVATLDMEYFDVVMRSVMYAPDMRATMAHAEGGVLVSMPAGGQVVGSNLATPGSLFVQHRQSGRIASLSTKSNPDNAGVDRIVALRTIDRADLRMDRPMVVLLDRELSAIYAPWITQAGRFGIFYGSIVLAVGLGLSFTQRRRRLLDRLATEVATERQRGEERLDLALRGADLGLWDVHIPSRNVVVNQRERSLLGFTPDALLPQAGEWLELIHPDDRAVIDAALLPHLRSDTVAYECEHRMRQVDGRYVWVSSRAMIVERDAEGRAVRIVGTHLDITERRRTDEELRRTADMLRQSEEQLRQVTDSLPALISQCDLDQRFQLANRAYGEWFGADPASLIGRTLTEVYGERLYGELGHHVETALTGTGTQFEREITTAMGQRHVEVRLIPYLGRDGSVQGVCTLITDVTTRRQNERERVLSEERLTLALEGSELALFDWDIPGDRLYHSAQASAMRDEPAVETTASASTWRAYVHTDDLDAMQTHIRAALAGAVPVYNAEFRIRKRLGDWTWIRARGRVVERDPAGRAIRLAGTYADINARKVADEQLRRRAEFDALTDLPNRTSFIERLQKAMARSTRASPMALMFLDIDHFKNINDTLGHEAGDQLLKVFATRMRDSVRESDTVARLAGDEFTVILEGLRKPDDAQTLAANLIEVLRAPIALAGRVFVITASIGIALQAEGERDDVELLRRADAALYEAKRRGRNGFFCERADAHAEPLDALGDTALAVRH